MKSVGGRKHPREDNTHSSRPLLGVRKSFSLKSAGVIFLRVEENDFFWKSIDSFRQHAHAVSISAI